MGEGKILSALFYAGVSRGEHRRPERRDTARPAPPLPHANDKYLPAGNKWGGWGEEEEEEEDARKEGWEVRNYDARTLYIAPTYFADPPRHAHGKGEGEREGGGE